MFQYKESTMEILWLPRFETFVLRVKKKRKKKKEKKVFTTAKFLPVWMRFLLEQYTKEICQLSGQRGKKKQKPTVDSL